MRKLLPVTVGTVLKELNEEMRGIYLERNPEEDDAPQLTRATFYRLEKRLDFPKGRNLEDRSVWRTYTPKEKEEIKKAILEYYSLI